MKQTVLLLLIAFFSATAFSQNSSFKKVTIVDSLKVRGSQIMAELRGSATLNFASAATLVSEDLTITVTGAAVGNPVSLGTPAAPAAGVFYAFVSATNTVTVRYINATAGTVDPASGTYKVIVKKY